MANIAGICARTPDLRDDFIKRVQLESAPFEGLSTGRADFKMASLCWAVPPEAPFSASQGGTESVFTVGDSGRDDFFLSLSEDNSGGVTLKTDALGLFPLYYYSTPDVFIFSTTPSVFKLYPGFQSQLDVEGLVGILLVNFIVGGQTLLKGVRRLSPGHTLSWKAGGTAIEFRSDNITPSDKYFGNSFEKNLSIIDGLFTAAVRKGREVQDPALLFSGGLDSRLLAGYLYQIHGRRVRAVTQGRSGDFELKCAERVARALQWEHHLCPADPSTFLDFTRLKLEQEHLAHGFATPYFMQMVSTVRSLSPVVYMGVHGDSGLGYATAGYVRDSKTKTFSFESHLKHLNRSGLSVENIQKLIPAPLLKGHLEEVIEKLRNIYNSLPGEPFQRAWLFDLNVADRLQVGFIERMMAFGSWPRLPFVDRALLEAMAGMPYEAVAGRRMERELLFLKFPKLAVLPLDRNSYDLSPVIGLKRMLAKNNLSIAESVEALRWHGEGKFYKWIGERFLRNFGKEKRFYYRTFDVNGDAWRGFRRETESCRRSAENFLDAGQLSRLWPGPSETIHAKDGITDTQSLKVLLGLSLWAKNNL